MRKLRWSRWPSGPECRVWPDPDRGTFRKSLLGSTVSTGKSRGRLTFPALKQDMKLPVISPARLDHSPSSPATRNTETEWGWPAMSSTEHLLLYFQPAMMRRPHATPGSQQYNRKVLFLLVNSRNPSLGLLWRSVSCMLACSVVSDSLRPHGLYPTSLLCPWDSPGKNTGVGCHSLLQGVFPTQGSNPGHLWHILCWHMDS